MVSNVTMYMMPRATAHLEMYEGTMAVKAAASRPAEERLVTSSVSRYDDEAASAEKIGARNTHTWRMLMVRWKKCSTQ